MSNQPEPEAPERIWLSRLILLSDDLANWHAHVTTKQLEQSEVEYIRADLARRVTPPVALTCVLCDHSGETDSEGTCFAGAEDDPCYCHCKFPPTTAATRFKVGDKVYNVHAPYLPHATITEITEKGFKYVLDKPVVISPRLGTQTGGESYNDEQWELVDAVTPAESNEIVGPNACSRCGGEYGRHESWCAPAETQGELRESDLQLSIDYIFRLEYGVNNAPGQHHGVAAAVLMYANELRKRGWQWDAEQMPTTWNTRAPVAPDDERVADIKFRYKQQPNADVAYLLSLLDGKVK